MKKEVIEKTVDHVTKSSLWKELISASAKASSMRFVFVVGTFFILLNWAIMTYIAIYKLSKTEPGLAVLAVVIGSISAGVIGLVTALAGTKAYQAKNENAVSTDSTGATK